MTIIRTLEPYHCVHFNAPCNLNCFYCYEERQEADLDRIRQEIEDSLRVARRAGYRVVAFTSGELLMLPFWKDEVTLARRLGFEEIALVTNLTLLDDDRLRDLEASGLTAVGGTIFALDDQEALSVAGREGIFKRQLAALRFLTGFPDLEFHAHLMITREMAKDLWTRIMRLRDLSPQGMDTLILSAIEPVSETVLRHRCYTSALDLDWEALLAAADEHGIFAVVQNVPACLLGAYAHRSFFLRKRVGRILHGWPEEEELVYAVNQGESLYGRLEPEGECRNCPLIPVCQRFFEYPRKKKVSRIDEVQVVRNLLAEEGIEGDPVRIAGALQRIEASRTYNWRLSGG